MFTDACRLIIRVNHVTKPKCIFLLIPFLKENWSRNLEYRTKSPKKKIFFYMVFFRTTPSAKTVYIRPFVLGLQLEASFQKSFQASVDVSEKEQGNDFLKAQKILQSKCALFVCNKWDDVKGPERVKEVVKRKLKSAWPGFDPESQLIYLSTKQALLAQEYGLNTDEFSSLMNGMRSVVLNAIGAKLKIQWR